MGRKKLAMKRIENAATRQVTYAKRKDGIVKKAHELSVLCDTDVALIMFSPIGRLNTFASNGRVEDIFLRLVERPDEMRGGPISNAEFLCQKLKQLKYEGQMLEKLAIIEEFEEKLDKLSRRQREAQDKMRYYEPDLVKINSALEAGVAQQFLTSSIQRVQLAKAKFLGNQIVSHPSIEKEENMVVEEDAASVTNGDFDVNKNSFSYRETNQIADTLAKLGALAVLQESPSSLPAPVYNICETCPDWIQPLLMCSMKDEDQEFGAGLSSMGPHLNLDYIEAQGKWNNTCQQ